MALKFGTGQFGNPAPKLYRAFETFYIGFFAPGFGVFIHEWGGLNDLVLHRLDITLVFSMSLIKGLGAFLGNGQQYVDKLPNQS